MGSRYGMTTLKPAKSGAFKARKRLPADVRSEYHHQFDGPAWEVKLTIPVLWLLGGCEYASTRS
jgi:hypothetical protein